MLQTKFNLVQTIRLITDFLLMDTTKMFYLQSKLNNLNTILLVAGSTPHVYGQEISYSRQVVSK